MYLRSNDNDKSGCNNCSKKHMVRKYTAIEVRFVVISSCKNKIKIILMKIKVQLAVLQYGYL